MALSDRSAFPNFFRTVPSDHSLAQALATVMQYYGWRQLSILTEGEQQFLELLPLLEGNLSRANISVVHSTTRNFTKAAETIFVSIHTRLHHFPL